jgi:hypothetical protein
MKTVWIVLGVFASVLVLCCISGVFFGNRLLVGVQTVNNEADLFSKKVVEEVAADWRPASLMKYASPEFKVSVTQDKLAKLFRFLESKLGPVKSVGEFTASNTSAQSWNGESYTLITTVGNATFAKGDGKVTLKVIKRRGQWAVVNFHVNSDALIEIPGLEPGPQNSERS